MKTRMYVVCWLSALGSFACASEPDEPDARETPPELSDLVIEATACTPLDGVYSIIYAKRSGDCADLPEQLATFSDRSSTSALNGNCQASVATSEDDCDREEEAVCPVITADGMTIGSANLVTAFSQTSTSRIEGMATIELSTETGRACSATYALIGQKVE